MSNNRKYHGFTAVDYAERQQRNVKQPVCWDPSHPLFTFTTTWSCFHLHSRAIRMEKNRNFSAGSTPMVSIKHVAFILFFMLKQIFLNLQNHQRTEINMSSKSFRGGKNLLCIWRLNSPILWLRGSHTVSIVSLWYLSLNSINQGQQQLLLLDLLCWLTDSKAGKKHPDLPSDFTVPTSCPPPISVSFISFKNNSSLTNEAELIQRHRGCTNWAQHPFHSPTSNNVLVRIYFEIFFVH